MKKKTIAGINFRISSIRNGLFFECDKKDDIKAALKIGLNGVVNRIQNLLDSKFGKGTFFYRAGGGIENGIEFNYSTDFLRRL